MRTIESAQHGSRFALAAVTAAIAASFASSAALADTGVQITVDGITHSVATVEQLAAVKESLAAAEAKAKNEHTTVAAGDNLSVSESANQNGGAQYTVRLADDIKVNSVTAAGGKIGSLTADESGTSVKTENAGFAVTADAVASVSGTASVVVQDGAVAAASGEKGSLVVSEENGAALKHGNSTVLVNDGTAAISGGTSTIVVTEGTTALKGGSTVVAITDEGVNAGGAQVKNIAAGTDDADAVNVKQMTDYVGNVLQDKSTVANGDNLQLVKGTNNEGGTEYQLRLADDIKVNSVTAAGGKIGALTASESGASVKTETAGFAVTNDAIAGVIGDPENPDTALVLSKDAAAISSNGASVAIANGTAAINGGNSAIVVTEGTTALKGGSTVVTITDDGVSAGGAQVKNIAAATEDTDAVNFGQAKGLQTVVKNGDNLVLSQATNATGGAEYTVSLAKDLQGLNSVQTNALAAGSLTADKTGVSVKTADAAFNVKEGAGIGATFGNSALAVTKDGAAIASAGSAFVAGTNQATVTGGSTTLTLSDSGADFGGAKVTGIAAGTSTYDAVNYGQLQQAYKHIGNIEKKASRGIAGVAAMANIPQVEPGKTFSIGAGIGSYGGYQALAIGASGRIFENTLVKGSVARSGSGQTVLGAGISHSW